MKRLVLAAVLLAIPLISLAGVYKWVDDKGHVHFGDKPPEDVKQHAKTVDVDVNVVHSESEPKQKEVRRLPPWMMQEPPPSSSTQREQATPSVPAARPTPSPPVAKPQPKPTGLDPNTDGTCEQRWERFNKSKACFDECAWTTNNFRPLGSGLYGDVGRDMSNCGHCVDTKKPDCKL